jgi:DNA ligase-1
MQHFARLCEELDNSSRTNDHIAALVQYFRDVNPDEAAWAVWFLSGNRPRRVVSTKQLLQWCAELISLPQWLLETSREFVGDLAETIALLLPVPPQPARESLTFWIEQRLLPLAHASDHERHQIICDAWTRLNQRQRFLFNKLLTGSFRIGVSKQLVVRALSQFSAIPQDVLSHRLMGRWKPTPDFFQNLLAPETADSDLSRPYPFCLANPLPPETAAELQNLPSNTPSSRLGLTADWVIEWKWDGIRAQLIRRNAQTFLWSRGEELLEGRFPELDEAATALPDGTVLDGEIVAWKNQTILPFAQLQKRINRRNLSRSLLTSIPVRFLTFDLLELNHADIRQLGTAKRRELLCQLPLPPAIAVAPQLQPASWEDCTTLFNSARTQLVEGLMLKRANAPCEPGRPTGLWWKWKSDPLHCDAVLLYAQRGHGRRAGRFTDFTFAVRHNEQLVPFAKAYSGLTKAEIEELDQFIKSHTIERFGPVTSVEPLLVFEIAFEGLQLSSRHRSGIAVRFPRIARWRRDKTAEQIDTLEHLITLANAQNLTQPPGPDSTQKESTTQPSQTPASKRPRSKTPKTDAPRQRSLFDSLEDSEPNRQS